ncbi:MAG: hypothetical protein N7Q72_01820 [Spiroplasma sp. Tabriz.8]|nr:hypothetical protein [Spiroplasma sp. Tabriz.8]
MNVIKNKIIFKIIFFPKWKFYFFVQRLFLSLFIYLFIYLLLLPKLH